jgi:PKD repeat protein
LTGVVPPPVASFTDNPTNGTAPLAVAFNDLSTGTITNRYWNFGDGATTNITATTIAHTYAAGVYPVTLVVAGPGGVSTNPQPSYIKVLTPYQAWQIQYFSTTNNPAADPNADPDGDGLNNQQEFLAGTNPTNSGSFFGITSILEQGLDLDITWMTGTGKTTAVQFAPGDWIGGYSNNFTDLFIVTNAIGPVTNYLDIGAATNVPARYYRVRLVP